MTSNNDILAFLKSEKEAREKEKEEEKAARSKERQEDMAKMANLIRDGVREEVKAAVKEVDERLVAQEKISQDLGKQIQSIMSELTTLKKGKETSRSGLPAQVVEEGVGAVGHGEGAVVSDTSTSDGLSDRGKILEICSKARKIVGFSPIEPRMLDIQMRAYGAQNVEEAMIMEVKSYLKCEMKVPQSEIEKLDIVRIFPPAKESWDTLYVEFRQEYQVDRIFSYTRVMVKQDHKVVRWFPKELFERFQALDTIAYNMREESKKSGTGAKLRTRVRVGIDDLEFSTKIPNGRWIVKPLPAGLPAIDLQARGKVPLTSSPPPGRPGRPCLDDDRKRQLSGSDVEVSAKKTKPSNDGLQVDLVGSQNGYEMVNQVDMIKDKQAEQGNDKGDPGKFTNEEAYCPSTPAKTKNILNIASNVSSPIFHNKSRVPIQ